MATLNFKGKSAVWNHHLSVPYHTLEKVEKNSLKGENDTENLIVQGDNLLALKALLPQYQGKVKCIYIDPPYNTGDEGWVYSDSVSSPIIKAWLDDAVGKDDLTRHDKWLCMMTPRLKLLRELLDSTGVIFINIDYNEVHRLRCLMDEIFGENNYIGDFHWKKKSTSTNVEGAQVSSLTDYTLCYAKSEDGKIKSRVRYAETRNYPYSDAEGRYRLTIVEKKNAGAYRRDSMTFKILGQVPREGKRWQLGEETARKLEEQGRFVVEDGVVKRKIYSHEDKDTTSAQPLLLVLDDVGTTDSAGDVLEDLFGVEEVFDNPKPPELIKHLINIVCDEDDIILDSFAGSGTTAQAVLELNAEDKGRRKFILVQLPEAITERKPAYELGLRWVHEITCERVRRVIKQDDLKTGFTYYQLGQAIDAETLLAGDLPEYKEFAKYVYYLASGKNHSAEKSINEKTYFVGKAENETVYLLYKQDIEALKKLAITLDWARETHEKDGGKKIVYAPACYLDDEALEQYNIKFVSIPYNLFERT